MEEISVREVTRGNVDDLCRICVPPEKRTDPIFMTGMELKRVWALGMLEKWGRMCQVGVSGGRPGGGDPVLLRPRAGDRPHPLYLRPRGGELEEGHRDTALIEPDRRRVGTQGSVRGEPPEALVTKMFPGEKPGQYPARLFFRRKGFRQVGDDPDLLYYPLRSGFVYRPRQERGSSYVPQEEDRGKTVFIYGPSPCPYAYVFLKRAERIVREMAPWIPIRWIDATAEPEEVEKRGGIRGCIVNAVPIKAFVLNEGAFKEEVMRALKA